MLGVAAVIVDAGDGGSTVVIVGAVEKKKKNSLIDRRTDRLRCREELGGGRLWRDHGYGWSCECMGCDGGGCACAQVREGWDGDECVQMTRLGGRACRSGMREWAHRQTALHADRARRHRR